MKEEFLAMAELMLWLYVINAVLLIDHEIDSAYWREWDLFKLPGGISGFLLLHLPLLFVILWGLILISQHSCWGSVFSLLLCAGGFFAFGIHAYFLRKGGPQFNTPTSKGILVALLLVSIVQTVVTLYGIGR
jgi:hypothetical protein